eukprot:2815442-Pyramimonas_sp.AAC.1
MFQQRDSEHRRVQERHPKPRQIAHAYWRGGTANTTPGRGKQGGAADSQACRCQAGCEGECVHLTLAVGKLDKR